MSRSKTIFSRFSHTVFRILLFAYYILPLANSVSARELSWSWWPTSLTTTPSVPYVDSLTANITMAAAAGTGKTTPFWLTTNTSGKITTQPFQGLLLLSVDKPATAAQRWYDYDFRAVALARTYSSAADLQPLQAPLSLTYKQGGVALAEAYAHLRLFVFDLTAGVAPLAPMMADTSLSMGSLLLSLNAPALPRLSIGIDRFSPIPGLFGYGEWKGGLTQAWLTDNTFVKGAMLHYKFFGIRVGGRLPVNFAVEIHHAAQWGGIHPTYGDLGNDMKAFVNTFFARSGGVMPNDKLNAQGNHIVSQQLTLTIKQPAWQIDAYWQNMAEDNLIFIGFGQNVRDGLWGINLRLNNQTFVQSIVYEYMNTTDQSGPWHDRDGLCYAGNDSYYRNSVYQEGWSAYMHTLGNPFLTSPLYNTDGSLASTNTRVRVHHVGVRGDVYGYNYMFKISHAKNYGNNQMQIQPLSDNTAFLLSVNKLLPHPVDIHIGLTLAADFGSQFGNNFGAMLTLSKSFGKSFNAK